MTYPGLTRTETQQIQTAPPEPRCGQCENCKYVEATRRIMLANPRGATSPRYDTADVVMWNRAVAHNPCTA
jgi:hypothetical protein